ncbi:glutathione S-transferase [Pantoea agglomerans]|uniref:glutathione S-transferase family protein n=1 Tax=Enterobacter agglomerans TaxID=549 RepID=UPI0012AE2886|nr:glutathione S-transferase N-terminal domain-containing protein [Pantoea agglomerans]MRT10453.1 glutathione S-transferase [Pantoea agglomerans]
MSSLTLYSSPASGHSHRVRLLLGVLGIEYQLKDVSAQSRKQADFLVKNPLGQVPVLEDGNRVIADSNAILVYLCRTYADGSAWLPCESEALAQVQLWLGKAAGEIRYGPGSARMVKIFGAQEDYDFACRVAGRLFTFMEQHLQTRHWLATPVPTIADIACYAYIAAAPEGGLSLESYPAIRSWLCRVESLPGFVPFGNVRSEAVSCRPGPIS